MERVKNAEKEAAKELDLTAQLQMRHKSNERYPVLYSLLVPLKENEKGTHLRSLGCLNDGRLFSKSCPYSEGSLLFYMILLYASQSSLQNIPVFFGGKGLIFHCLSYHNHPPQKKMTNV